MATLVSSHLTIQLNLPNKMARVVVTGRVQFTTFEFFMLQHGVRFRLDCKIWGEDLGQGNWLNADDNIFSYASMFFPDTTPAQTENFTFSRDVPQSTLDEDLGTDDIYGEVTITNLENLVRSKQKTNVIHHS